VLKHRETYEIMRAQDVGWSTNKLVLGKLSGRNAFKTRLAELGIELASEEAMNLAFAKFKALADKKGQVFDEDLQALVSDEDLTPEREHYKFESLKVVSESGATPYARVAMSIDGREASVETTGDGPVDATFKAIEQMAKSGSTMLLFSVNAITTGTDAQGEVTVRLERDGRIVNGNGADTDIIVASAKAYINALNKLHDRAERLNPQLAVHM
jgi:2-isopropylmalate synthase